MSAVLRKSIIFIGVGLCGCRQVKELMDRGFEGFLINTSETDFQLLGSDISEKRKYKIPDADGVDKKREKAFEIFGNRIDEISTYVLRDHSSFQHYVFVFSLGGGSGSGGAPALAEHFGYTFEAEGMDKTVSIMGTNPDEKDGLEALYNAKDCMSFIENHCSHITSKIYLDNSTMKDKFAINTQIADLIGGLMSLPKVNEEVDIKTLERNGMKQSDGEEALALWRTKGCINMAIINPNKPQAKDGEEETGIIEPVVFIPPYNKKPIKMAVSASPTLKLDGDNGEVLRQELIKALGQHGSDIKAGYNDSDVSYAYTFGHATPQHIIDNLNKMIENIENNVSTEEEEILDFGSKGKGLDALFGQSKAKSNSTAGSPFAKLTGNSGGSPFGKSKTLGKR